MNSYILNRALGSISPTTFHVAQTTRLVHHLEPAPGIRFASRKPQQAGCTKEDGDAGDIKNEILAHRSGVNVLAIDQFEGRW